MKVAYFVHDLNDAAVARRVRMLRAGGAEVALAGFWRGLAAPETVAGVPVLSLGRTQDGQLAKRALSVAKLAAAPDVVRRIASGAEVVMARNLEMLALAARARSAAKPGARLIYESLDIHRSLLGTRAPSRMLRGLEKRLMAGVDLLLTSSPAFLRHYFEAQQDYRGPHMLVENKVLQLDEGPAPATTEPPDGPPWRIGWFGMLRCEKSLAILSALAAASDGRVEVVLRGRPARSTFADFDAAVARAPGVSFEGAYSPSDLPRLYGEIHFTWAIDYFEEGLNSSWLLPNRLYEGSLHGAVPLALADVETGAWLARHEAGVRLSDPAMELSGFFDTLTPARYAELRRAVSAIPQTDLIADDQDCRLLVRAISGETGA